MTRFRIQIIPKARVFDCPKVSKTPVLARTACLRKLYDRSEENSLDPEREWLVVLRLASPRRLARGLVAYGWRVPLACVGCAEGTLSLRKEKG